MENLEILDPDGDAIVIMRYTPVSDTEPAGMSPRPTYKFPALVLTMEQDRQMDLAAVFSEPSVSGSRDSELSVNQSIPTETRFLVSSKHLTLSSPYFKARLGPCWTNDITILETGQRELEIKDFDLEAVRIVLLCLHCQYHKVFNDTLRNLPLTLLSNVILFSDYIQCLDEIRPLVAQLIPSEQFKPPHHLEDSIRYTWIAYILRLRENFRLVTKNLIYRVEEPIDCLDVPLPTIIQDAIEKERKRIIGSIFRIFERSRPDVRCCDSCRAATLGYFVCLLVSADIDYIKGAPYLGTSIESIVYAIQRGTKTKMAWWCDSKKKTIKTDQAMGFMRKYIGDNMDFNIGLNLDGFETTCVPIKRKRSEQTIHGM